jgi:pyridoxine 5'-phosphate synthase PdxJ
MSMIEQIAKGMGISSKELFSGKYGNSYDQILMNLAKKKQEADKKVEKALKELKKKGWKISKKKGLHKPKKSIKKRKK